MEWQDVELGYKKVALVKNHRMAFGFDADLDKGSEKSEANKKRQIQEEIRVVVHVQIAALRFIDAGAGYRSNEKKKKLQIQEEIRVVVHVQIAALRFIDAGAGDRSNEKKKKLQIQPKRIGQRSPQQAVVLI
ncbi:unnamed protein product [Prunus brigantina]